MLQVLRQSKITNILDRNIIFSSVYRIVCRVHDIHCRVFIPVLYLCNIVHYGNLPWYIWVNTATASRVVSGSGDWIARTGVTVLGTSSHRTRLQITLFLRLVKETGTEKRISYTHIWTSRPKQNTTNSTYNELVHYNSEPLWLFRNSLPTLGLDACHPGKPLNCRTVSGR